MPTTLSINSPGMGTVELLLDGPEQYYISGTVTDVSGTPAERTVRLYLRSTGALLGTVTSDAVTGAFEFPLGTVGPETYNVVAIATGAAEPDLIHRVTSGHD